MALLYLPLILTVAASMQWIAVADTDGDLHKTERDVRRDIFNDYDKTARPVKRASTAVPVEINMSLLKIRSMDEREQLISLETWLKLKWTDEYLQWDPKDYDNITIVHVSPTEIWRPDVTLYTASPVTSIFPTAQTQAILYNTGTILWIPPFTMSSRCPIPFKNYATSARTFVECNMQMGSWTYSGKMLNLQLSQDEIDLSNFQDYNHEWKLVKIHANRESKLYPCCPEPYPLINFNITLKKRNYYLSHT